MNERDDRELFSHLRSPRLPADLKQPVLHGAIRALGEDTPPRVWDRLWESRTLRAAWVVVTMGLIVAHVAISVSPGSARRPSGTETARGQMEDLRGVLDLPSVEISPRAEALVMGRRARQDESSSRDNTRKSEVPS